MSRWTRSGLLGALAALCVFAAPVSAQRPTLERVEELARLGRPEEARSVLLEWWDGPRAEASRRDEQRGLWLRGRLTVDPVQAQLDFQRLVVLYPRGGFTADALFRLAQGAYAMGDETAARAYIATLTEDHAGSPAAGDAERWLRSAGAVPVAPGTAPGGRTTPEVADPPEERVVAPPRGPETDPVPREAPRPLGDYFVQLGAFADEDRALALFEEVTGAGIDVRLVRVEGSRFLHVRFGRFVVRADAVDELERLTQAGISAALVRDERAEERVRD